MTNANRATGSLRELARRTDGGIEVALFWDVSSGELTLCVGNEPGDSYFELSPAPDQALDCFYHPYAYAALDPLAGPVLLAAETGTGGSR
jgi:hypothetical protein